MIDNGYKNELKQEQTQNKYELYLNLTYLFTAKWR